MSCFRIVDNNGNWVCELTQTDYPDWLQKCKLFFDLYHDNHKTISLKTSGSTGIPKQIEVDKYEMRKSAIATGNFFKLHFGTKALLALPVNFVSGSMMLVRAITLGWELWATNPQNIQFFENSYFDFTALSPMQFIALAEKKDLKKHFRIILLGGTNLSSQQMAIAYKAHNNVWQSFGMTETLSHFALRQLNGDINQPYVCLPNIAFRINNNGELILLKAPNVYSPIATNDIVKLVDINSFQWLGRADWTINSGGIKIHAEVLESNIEQLVIPHHLEFRKKPWLIGSQKHPIYNQTPVLVVEQLFEEEQIIELLKILKESLPKFQSPTAIMHNIKIDQSENGKLLRKNFWTK